MNLGVDVVFPLGKFVNLQKMNEIVPFGPGA
jgi:hypothetical protein